MEIVNSKQIKKFVCIVSIITFCFTIIPMIFYFKKFNGTLSSEQMIWGVFGDYVGGIIGTLFNLIAVIFSLISIYITLKVATRIHENEQTFNIENTDRETKRFQKEIELTHKQNQPFPYIDAYKFAKETKIVLCNYGIGPMVINQWSVVSGENSYTSFGHLISKNVKNEIPDNQLIFLVNTAETHIIPAGGEKVLLHIKSSENESEKFIDFQTNCRNLLKDSIISLEYSDIFDVKNKFLFKLEFYQ